jgi:hypothetical protein
MKITSAKSKYFNGYKGPRQTNISPSESVDVKESVRDFPFNKIENVLMEKSWVGDIPLNMIRIQRI